MPSFSITRLTLLNGEPRYKSTVKVKYKSKIIHRESKIFKKKILATTFGKNRVSDLEKNGINSATSCSIGSLIDKYMNDKDLYDTDGRTKRRCIRFLRDCDISNIQTNELKISDLIKHCRNRKSAGTSPATISHDMSYLKAVLKQASPVFDIEANHQLFKEAFAILKKMELIGKSQKRTRRPTTEELIKLKKALKEREKD